MFFVLHLSYYFISFLLNTFNTKLYFLILHLSYYFITIFLLNTLNTLLLNTFNLFIDSLILYLWL